jgi:putative tricarboxylic transport membrane protein
MGEILQGLMGGFATALQPLYLYYAFIGTILGTVTGVLPGIGPLGSMAILLSFTLRLDATAAMILFAGIYYGAMYGGSTTSILLNIPGEAASVVTCIDGYKMAQKGRGGAALAVAAVGSFVAGTLGIFGIIIVVLFLSDIALYFGPSEFFAISLCGLAFLVRLTRRSVLRSSIMILAGMAVGTIGLDLISGIERFTFGIDELEQGIGFLPVAMGLLGISEILFSLQQNDGATPLRALKMRELLPTKEEWRRSTSPIFRGSLVGFLIGLVPGPSPMISTFVSYITEKKLSRHPEAFGRGAIEGVAGPEAANNAAVAGAYVPLFALGIPFTPAMAMVLGALMLHGVTPGPAFFKEKADIFWAVVASMYVGNFMLLVLNLPLVNLFVRILRVPQRILGPIVILICLVGVYSVNGSFFEMALLVVFGVIGYILRLCGFPVAPLVLALVIGPILETSLRQALAITGGNFFPLITRPIPLVLYTVTLLAFLIPKVAGVMRKRRQG